MLSEAKHLVLSATEREILRLRLRMTVATRSLSRGRITEWVERFELVLDFTIRSLTMLVVTM